MTQPSRAGRRSATRRRWLSPTAVIGALLPLLTVAALVLVRPAPSPDGTRTAEVVRPQRVDLVCPTGLRGPTVAVAAAGKDEAGDVTRVATTEVDPSPVDLAADSVTTVRSPEVTRLRATGSVAAELLGARFASPGLSTSDCVFPQADYWFSGVGAGAEHSSVLELTNPDEGPAVADVTVFVGRGSLDTPNLRGVTVPGGETLRLELAEEIPRRSEIGMHIAVSRGRMTATVEDGLFSLGRQPDTRGWLPGAPEPTTDQLLLGLSGQSDSDTLVLTNPGEDEARVELRVATEEAAFVPEGQQEIRVGPGSVESVSLTDALRTAVRDGAVGVQLAATQPVLATLRSVVEEDLVHAAPVSPSENAMTALLPPGDARLVLAQAGGAGLAVVTAYADGEELARKRVELTDGSGATVDLPDRTALVRVTPRDTEVSAAVVVSGDGSTVVPLRELVRRSLVPDVRPGLP